MYVSSGLREVRNCSSAVHQLPPEMATASSARSAEALNITAQWLAIEQEPPSFSLSDSLSLSLSSSLQHLSLNSSFSLLQALMVQLIAQVV